MCEKELGRIVLNLRRQRGLTIEELSSKANISRSQLYYLETGKRKISFTTVHKVATALGCDILSLLKEQTEATI